MRPYSKYLEKVKSETHNVRWNLSGTTPPLKYAAKAVRVNSLSMELTESRGSEAHQSMKHALSKRTGFSENNIEFFPGTSQAIFQLFAALTKHGDSILVEKPTYSPIIDIAKFLGLKVIRFQRTANFDKDFKALSLLVQKSKLIFITNPHCPSGRFLDQQQIHKLDTLGRPVIIDEIYLPHFLPERLSLVSPTSKNLISISGFSKTVGVSSVRLSWALGNSKYLTPASKMGFNLLVDLPTPSFVVGRLVLDQWDIILKDLHDVIEQNRKTLETFSDTLGPYLSHNLKTGNFAMLKLPPHIRTEVGFIAQLKKQSVFLRPGSDFEMKNHFRFHLMADPIDFKNAIQRIVSLYER